LKASLCNGLGVGETYSRDKGWGGGRCISKDPIVVFYITTNFKLSIRSKLHRDVTLSTCVQAFFIEMQSRVLHPMRPNQVHWDLEIG
jgi:hypothetical protein